MSIRYVQTADGQVWRADKAAAAGVVGESYRLPEVERDDPDLDFSRAHRDELKAKQVRADASPVNKFFKRVGRK